MRMVGTASVLFAVFLLCQLGAPRNGVCDMSEEDYEIAMDDGGWEEEDNTRYDSRIEVTEEGEVQIEMGCRQDSDCGIGEFCVAGICIAQECRQDSDCGIGEFCDAGICMAPECRQDSDCGAGWRCHPGDSADDRDNFCAIVDYFSPLEGEYEQREYNEDGQIESIETDDGRFERGDDGWEDVYEEDPVGDADDGMVVL